ncbi:DUF317 domain-containing protein [Streptomyces niveus]|uniref:DUF317 domain-containing protein n=1 Tax=Streptomyces niveus TaxID=193462 RepID=A0A1U9QL40_STRNV|nr:DUF317 domain-containing protein [Streptomyces niveus]AQU64900.1 hypothetical protein BBN63_00050 [Streptomyces niveus]
MTKAKKKNQWAGWGPGEHPEQHYLVTPRHLAGGGDLRHVTEYLRASGWKDQSKTGGPLVFDSPDRSIRVGYDPFVQPGGWTISAKPTPRQEAWVATFGPRLPVEIVAGFTDALAQPRSAHAPNVWEPLHQQGWRSERAPHVRASSPDGTAFLQFHQTGPGQAMWWARAANEHGIAWHATFTPTTPMHLIAAFNTALAHPDPVMRPRGHVPPSRHTRTRSMSVQPFQLRAWQQTRITAARAATWALNTTTRRPATTPAGPRQTSGGSYARR